MKTCLADVLFDALLDEPKHLNDSIHGSMDCNLMTSSKEGGDTLSNSPLHKTTVPWETLLEDVLEIIEAELLSFGKSTEPFHDSSFTSSFSTDLEPTPIKPGLLLRQEEKQASDPVNCEHRDAVPCTFVDYNGAAKENKRRNSDSSEDQRPNKRSRKASTKRQGTHPSFRPYQHHKFQEKYDALLRFKEKHGHCLVPHTFDEDPALSRWVKRQRYQYKLKMAGNDESTMTEERIVKLESIGFVWDSHKLAWEDHLKELSDYRKEHGDCNVPSTYQKNPALGAWVKCQRRQYRRLLNGESYNITSERIASLDALGFDWKQRKDIV